MGATQSPQEPLGSFLDRWHVHISWGVFQQNLNVPQTPKHVHPQVLGPK